MKSSSESMLVVVGVAGAFFLGSEFPRLCLSVVSVAVGVESLWWEHLSDVVSFRKPWAAFGSASSAIASAAFLFLVVGGVVKVAAKMPTRGGGGVISERSGQTPLGKTCDGHG